TGRTADAALAYREALRLGTQDLRVQNNLAWILATSPDPGLRDPAAAVGLAEQAAAASGGPAPRALRTPPAAVAAAAPARDARAAALRARARAEEEGDAEFAAELRARLDAAR